MTREISYLQFNSLYKEGMNDVEIGKALGFKKHQVRSFRVMLELPPNIKRKYNFTEEMDEKIKDMHENAHPMTEIAEELGMPYLPVRSHCLKLGIDTGKWKYQRRGMYLGRAKVVLEYLEEHGPTWKSELIEKLGVPGSFFSKFTRDFFDDAEFIKFKRGKGKRVRQVHEVYGELTNCPFLALRNDPRIIDFVAKRIPMKVENGRDAAVLAQNLGGFLGKERAREVIERLYTYVKKPPKRPHMKRLKKIGIHGNAKFTDEEFLMAYKEGFNDVEAADVLGVAPKTIGVRRIKLGLPTQRQRKRLKELLGGEES